jgi:hypothetical protein
MLTRGRENVSGHRIPRNEAGVALAQQIAARTRDQSRGNTEKARMAKRRFRAALRERRLKRAEAAIMKEAIAVHDYERDALYEASKRMSNQSTRTRRYMVETAFQGKQERLNQMLIDDRHHPRYSHPTPLKMPTDDKPIGRTIVHGKENSPQ